MCLVKLIYFCSSFRCKRANERKTSSSVVCDTVYVSIYKAFLLASINENISDKLGFLLLSISI